MPKEVEVHVDFRHDTSGWLGEYGDLQVTKPYQFRAGDVVSVPEDAADYFIRAGWASDPGGQPVKPAKGKPVFVQPDNGVLGQKAREV